MATTFESSVATPNTLRYLVRGDGTPSNAARTQAQVVASCAAGPLKQFLQGLTTANFNLLGAGTVGTPLQVSVVSITATANVPAGPFGVAFGVVSGSLTAYSGAVVGDAAVTLRFIQSDDR